MLLGTAATVIASQALISGVFSLTYQAIRLGYFPRLTVRHASHETMGQIHVPFMNAFLAASSMDSCSRSKSGKPRPKRLSANPAAK